MAEKKAGHESTWGSNEADKEAWLAENGDTARKATEKANEKTRKAARDA